MVIAKGSEEKIHRNRSKGLEFTKGVYNSVGQQILCICVSALSLNIFAQALSVCTGHICIFDLVESSKQYFENDIIFCFADEENEGQW